MTEIYSGGCLCGGIRFEARGEPGNPHSCSCRFCQQHSGALTVAWVEFPSDQVKWLSAGGKPSIFRSSDYSSRAFCPACGSSIGAIDDAPTIALLVGSFDEPGAEALKPLSHSFEDGCPRWWQPRVLLD
ncbi:ribulose-phosphate 3-epimerase [Devosia epidermidihirudinis]|uniref:Ribulose-phosphate 3-epimerase n=1 Tax=Devosia epidermidihirudinis TaxID=1293439 RepID=A0A0F5Q799_9HYPH|nr:GFA family protein [Devosia epidermidihirudinis]KKC35894.1 ribulose-phosphate 3-epimerase [Devosia epidermidihirudinis]